MWLELEIFAFGKANNAENDGGDAGSSANDAQDETGDGKTFHKAIPPVKDRQIVRQGLDDPDRQPVPS